MKEMKLSSRLEAVAGEIPFGATIADIGTDHAHLPCYTCLYGMAEWAIAGDLAEGSLQAAHDCVNAYCLEEKVNVRRGDGLEVVKPDEVDVIVIAGMGGRLMSDILEAGHQKLAGVSKLILQPNIFQ